MLCNDDLDITISMFVVVYEGYAYLCDPLIVRGVLIVPFYVNGNGPFAFSDVRICSTEIIRDDNIVKKLLSIIVR